MPPLGVAMVQLDLPGHGYSEGERAYVKSYTHWVDDTFQVRCNPKRCRFPPRRD